MFKLLLISIVVGPVWLAIRAARARRGRALPLFLGLVAAYDIAYLLMLYYLHVRWVGWGG